jgi:hypothetical protein
MPIDIFDTRTMLEAVRLMKPPRTFLKDTFFPNQRTFDTETVDIDIVKGKRRMAPLVNPKNGGKVVERLGYTTNTYKAPMINPKMATTAENIMKRMPGETIYSGMSPDERAQQQLGFDLVELEDMITRREEWMCAQALFNGKLDIKGEGVNDQIDFYLTNKEALAAAAKWNAATGDPLADLKRWRQTIIQKSGINPDRVIMASNVVDVFVNNAKVKDKLDLRWMQNVQLSPQAFPDGTTYLGRIAELALDIYSYDEWYIDDDNIEKPMIPANTVWVGSTNTRFEMLYGAYIDLELGTLDLPRIPRSWVTKDPSTRWLQMVSRPLPLPKEIDSMFVATVL